MNVQDEIDFLRAKIRDYLVITLDEGVLEVDKASEIAQATLNLLPDGLTEEQVVQALTQLQQKYPEQANLIHAAKIACEVVSAREVVDSQIIPLIKQGNVDSALDRIKLFNLK